MDNIGLVMLLLLLFLLPFAKYISSSRSSSRSSSATTAAPPLLFPLKVLLKPSWVRPETNLTVLPPSKELPRAAYLLTTTESWSVVVPSGHDRTLLERTSIQAAKHHCRYASNGGPFQKDGSCVGAVVSNGHVVAQEFGSVGFGLASQWEQDENRQVSRWVIGSIDNTTQATTLGLQQFVTGFDWLVYDGMAVSTAEFNNTTGAEEAPRTAIGVNNKGQLMLLVTDGCELWYVDD
jgi:hypothetical protein